MKRFLLVMLPVLAVAAVLVFAPGYLAEALDIKTENTGECLNLGFVCEMADSSSHKFYLVGDEMVGECVTLNLGLVDLDRVASKLGLTITKKYTVDDNYIIEGVSPRLNYHIDGRQANVMIAVSQRGMTVASPIIYGSY